MKHVLQRNRLMKILRDTRLYLLLAAVIISLIPTSASAQQPMSLQFDVSFKPDHLAFRPVMRTDPVVFLTFNQSAAAQGEHTVVRLVIFWMDSCGHCHYVLEELLPLGICLQFAASETVVG